MIAKRRLRSSADATRLFLGAYLPSAHALGPCFGARAGSVHAGVAHGTSSAFAPPSAPPAARSADGTDLFSRTGRRSRWSVLASITAAVPILPPYRPPPVSGGRGAGDSPRARSSNPVNCTPASISFAARAKSWMNRRCVLRPAPGSPTRARRSPAVSSGSSVGDAGEYTGQFEERRPRACVSSFAASSGRVRRASQRIPPPLTGPPSPFCRLAWKDGVAIAETRRAR